MIRTILAAVDGSPHALMALALSADLAARYNARLVLLHVVGHDGEVPEALYDRAARELEEAERGGRETGRPGPRRLQVLAHLGDMLLREAQVQAEAKGVTAAESVLDVGDPALRILHHAKERAADLIVMGSRGFGRLKGLALGSVSHKVFHLAPCACVTLHRSDRRPELEGIRCILVPTDGSAQADKAVDLASGIAERTGAGLVLLYVMTRGPSLEDLRAAIDMDRLSASARAELDPARHPIAEHISSAFMPPVVSRPALKEIGQQVLERGRQAAVAGGVRAPKLLLRDGDPARTIVNVARREGADLIAMGSRGLGGAEGLLTGSVSYKVSHTARRSCLVVR